MEIRVCGAVPTRRATADNFMGTVWQDPLVDAPDNALLQANLSYFEPGSRTAWHTHPMGQTLVITAGFGLIQVWGEEIREMRSGDVIWIPPGEKHWHGAGPNSMMAHISMQEKMDGRVADWMEHVTDDQYAGR